MTSKKSLIKFILILVLSGALGACGSIILMRFSGSAHALAGVAEQFLINNALTLMIVVFAILLILSVMSYFQGKRLYTNAHDDDIILQKADDCISLSMIYTTANIIALFMFYAIGLLSFRFELDFSVWPILTSTVFLLVATLVLTYMQVIAVNFTKILYPEKKGDPLDMKFNKVWLNSCDEAEQFLIYASAFRTFNLLKSIFPVLMVLLVIAALFFDIGILPIILLASLWAIHSLSYMFYTFKPAKQR